MRTKKSTQRSFRPRDHVANPKIDQELIDDQKFQQKLEAEQFTDGIEPEANEVILCPSCASSNRRMKPWYQVDYVANNL